MGIRSTMCWLGVTAVLSSVLAADEPKKPDAESMGWKHMATLSPLKAAPVLDGKLAGGEWDGAVGTVNFLDLGQTDGREEPSAKAMFMELRGGRTYCGWHGDRLYIAVVSELPPRSMSGKYSWPANRDAELVFDPNGIEIWLDPNRDRRETREGDQAFYQVFVNTLGSLYDARLEPGKAPDKGWDADIRTANTTDSTSKTWTMEMSVPLKELGFTPPYAGKSMGVLIARNYKSLWQQVTWFPHGRPFVSWQFYPRIIFTPDEPVVAVASLGDKFWEARPEFVLKITNPGPARTAKVKTHVRSSDMPDLRDEKEIALPANGAAEYRFKPGDGTLHETADHLAKFRVEAADGNTAWFDYAYLAPGSVFGKINLNTATERVLTALPGVTPELARNIMLGTDTAGRPRLKPYKNLTDVLDVRAMTPEIFSQLCNLVTTRSDQFRVMILVQSIVDVNRDGIYQPERDQIGATAGRDVIVDRSDLTDDDPRTTGFRTQLSQ